MEFKTQFNNALQKIKPQYQTIINNWYDKFLIVDSICKKENIYRSYFIGTYKDKQTIYFVFSHPDLIIECLPKKIENKTKLKDLIEYYKFNGLQNYLIYNDLERYLYGKKRGTKNTKNHPGR